MIENNNAAYKPSFNPVSISKNINDIEKEEKEVDNDLLSILERENRNMLYEVLMCFNQVRGHNVALAIYIFSIIGFSLLIMQVVVILKPISREFLFSINEEISLCCLIFLSISLGFLMYEFVIKPEFFKRLTIAASISTSILSFLMIFLKSHYMFYVLYPLICFIYSILYFNCLEMFNDYFFASSKNPTRNKVIYKKNIIHSFFSLSSLLLCGNYYIILYNLGFEKWNTTFTLFLLINKIICVLSFYIEESALNLKRNGLKSEEIMEHFSHQMKREFHNDEIKTINYDLFVLLERIESSRLKLVFSSIYKRSSIIIIIVMALMSYIVFGLIYMIPTIIYDQLKTNPMSFVNKLFSFFFLSLSGQIIGALLVYFTVIPRRYILSYFFFIIVIFSLFANYFEKVIFTCGGIMLFSAFVNLSVIYHFTYEIYSEDLCDKAYKLFFFSFLIFSIILLPLCIFIYNISLIAGIYSIMITGALGTILSPLINKDIKVIKRFNY